MQNEVLTNRQIAIRLGGLFAAQVAIGLALATVAVKTGFADDFAADFNKKFAKPVLTSEQIAQGCKIDKQEMGGTATPVPFPAPPTYEVVC